MGRSSYSMFAGIAATATLCLVACANRGLSREAAAAAIIASNKFPVADYLHFRRTYAKMDSDGHIFQYGDFGNNESPHAFIRQGLAEYAVENAPNKAEIDRPDITYFVQAGLLTATFAGHPGNVFSYVTLSFPDKTKALESPTNDQQWTGFKMCDLVFGEISGIQVNEQAGTAMVEYSVRRANWSDFGNYYRKTEALPEVINKRATFSRYDDGWRLTGTSQPSCRFG